ncbi:hypothetical protein Tco_0700349 [Tanacetum coccineum]
MDFCDKHNMVAFLQKPTRSEEFHQIVDFLASSHIKYALTTNPSIYVPLIEQFWQSATVETVNDGEQRISSNIATVIICLATNGIFKFSKLIFDGMVKNVDSKTKFLMYPRFIQMLLNKKKRLLKQHKKTYVAPSLTQKLFSNMKRGFSGEHIPLFDSMLIHDQPGQGEGPTLTIESQHTPIASLTTSQPTTSQPMSSQEQPSQVPTTEPIITTSSTPLYETNIPHTTSSMPHDSPLSGGDTPGSDEGSKKLNELTELCTKLFDKVTSLEEDLKQTKKVYGKALTKLVKKVKYLEDKLKSTSVRRKARMITPTKVSQGEEQSQESFEVQLDVLSAAKILVDASRERVKTYKSYTRRSRSIVSSRDSTVGGLFCTAEEILSTNERIAQKLNEEEMAKAATREEQERIDFEKALELQKQLDEREETDNID